MGLHDDDDDGDDDDEQFAICADPNKHLSYL